VFKIGQHLLDAKALVGRRKLGGPGKFGKWLEDEFQWSDRTAHNYMNVAIYFSDQIETVANSRITVTALYELAQDRVSQKARDEALKIATKPNGETLGRARAIEIIERNPGPQWTPPRHTSDISRQKRKSVISQYLNDPVNFVVRLKDVIGECFADPKKYDQLLDLMVEKCSNDPDKLALARKKFEQPAASTAP
jgi:hypothetical protein